MNFSCHESSNLSLWGIRVISEPQNWPVALTEEYSLVELHLLEVTTCTVLSPHITSCWDPIFVAGFHVFRATKWIFSAQLTFLVICYYCKCLVNNTEICYIRLLLFSVEKRRNSPVFLRHSSLDFTKHHGKPSPATNLPLLSSFLLPFPYFWKKHSYTIISSINI